MASERHAAPPTGLLLLDLIRERPRRAAAAPVPVLGPADPSAPACRTKSRRNPSRKPWIRMRRDPGGRISLICYTATGSGAPRAPARRLRGALGCALRFEGAHAAPSAVP